MTPRASASASGRKRRTGSARRPAGYVTHRDELLEKLATGQAELTDKHEQRLVSEIERLQTKAGEDLSRLREEHTSARDREIRALRDLRDAAVADAHVARRDLVDLRKGYDDLLTSHRQSQKNADVSHAELSGQLRMKSMELERVSMLHGEASSVAKVLRIECETLTKKCRLLESQYLQLESNAARTRTESDMSIAEMAARLSHYEGLERELDEAVLRQAAGKENVGSGSIGGAGSDPRGSVNSSIDGLNALSGAVPASLRRRLQQSVALGRRVNELERNSPRPRHRATPRSPNATSSSPRFDAPNPGRLTRASRTTTWWIGSPTSRRTRMRPRVVSGRWGRSWRRRGRRRTRRGRRRMRCVRT